MFCSQFAHPVKSRKGGDKNLTFSLHTQIANPTITSFSSGRLTTTFSAVVSSPLASQAANSDLIPFVIHSWRSSILHFANSRLRRGLVETQSMLGDNQPVRRWTCTVDHIYITIIWSRSIDVVSVVTYSALISSASWMLAGIVLYTMLAGLNDSSLAVL